MDGTALILCEGAFGSPAGKTAHGLVRFTRRYEIVGVIDSQLAGLDAGEFLDGRKNGILIFRSLDDALARLPQRPDYLVIGVATDGGVLPREFRPIIAEALRQGINVDSGLHQWLSTDKEFADICSSSGAVIRDIRRTPPFESLHFFSGKIEEVKARRIAVLGVDSACGKRTTALLLTKALKSEGIKAVFIGTGQTAWFQGVEYCIILDALINDFVTGELEHIIWQADKEQSPDVIIIEGQGSLTHPAYPSGYELLSAGCPDGVVYQVVPGRMYYDGFPGYRITPPEIELQIIDLIRPESLLGITVNSEGLSADDLNRVIENYEKQFKVPCCNPLDDGCAKLIPRIKKLLRR
ncbi:DUF1611 domain-containing protein [Candidatus Sumerlaeota bacterium]|nr:DUF1611 domain-containing protein [Candidatus Sumerlaeota bacterium]